eukprot:COSAG02_NODE_35376_length_469_cov_0.956757_1_plen_133_part_00
MLAGAGSLRSLILHRWESLSLPAQPSGSDNGVHASASPLEAAVERAIWLKTSLSDGTTSADPLVKDWKAAGLPLDLLQRWSENPEEVRIADSRCTLALAGIFWLSFPCSEHAFAPASCVAITYTSSFGWMQS